MAGLFIVRITRVGGPQSLILISQIIERQPLSFAPLSGRSMGSNGIAHHEQAAPIR